MCLPCRRCVPAGENTEATCTIKHTVMALCAKRAAGPGWAKDAGGSTELRARRKLLMKKEGGGRGKAEFTTSPSGLAVLSFWFGWSNEW